MEKLFLEEEEEDWSITSLVDKNWCIPEIQEARVRMDKIDREKGRPLKTKLPLSNLSGAELRQEAVRMIVALGLYPEEEIQSSHHRKRQMGCKDKNILTTDHRVTTTEIAESSGEEGITNETLANTPPGPDE
ncbi:unnamed protein product [Eruca vesicaria subsp. sativa]|uniref:Uncharacterized protein n=1 Tax=Eruca vesicaria subsp. sativa TaxID=29727 RepID=A0ABC8JSL1_ERUVS|nr:unnamed protein product [Eruca vesicaria subsp. sativa]